MLHRVRNTSSSRSPLSNAKGILNDWDLAAKVDEKGDIPISQRCFRTGTKPFLSLNLLQTPSPPHHYRHDLESFFWILIWAALHYDLNGKKTVKRKEVISRWCDGSFEEARQAEVAFLRDKQIAEETFEGFTPTFASLKEKWIKPLYDLLRLEYQVENRKIQGAYWTFKNFMNRLGR